MRILRFKPKKALFINLVTKGTVEATWVQKKNEGLDTVQGSINEIKLWSILQE